MVWVAKYWRRILKPFVEGYLRKVLPKLLRSMLGASIETIGFDRDHIHRVMVMLTRYSKAAVMGQLKSQSSHHMRVILALLGKVYWKEIIVWSPGYIVSSVGVNEDMIRR